MKYFSILIITTLLSCNSNQETKKHIDKPDTTETANSITPSDDNQNGDTLKTEIIETFVDSLNIGEKGKCKVELIKHRVYDGQLCNNKVLH